MTFFGGCFAGPVLHNWYRFLDRTIRFSTPARSLFGRVAVDQMFFAPCFIASFFVGQGLLAGENWQTIRERLQKVLFFFFSFSQRLPIVEAITET